MVILMVMIMGQSRIFLGMSKDGLIPPVFSKIHGVSGTPKTNLLILGARRIYTSYYFSFQATQYK